MTVWLLHLKALTRFFFFVILKYEGETEIFPHI